jgi:hypothetical protein
MGVMIDLCETKQYGAEYRIRHAVLRDDLGNRRKAYIAERRRSFFGLFSFWFPMPESKWHDTPEMCRRDIEYDWKMREPLDPPETVMKD